MCVWCILQIVRNWKRFGRICWYKLLQLHLLNSSILLVLDGCGCFITAWLRAPQWVVKLQQRRHRHRIYWWRAQLCWCCPSRHYIQSAWRLCYSRSDCSQPTWDWHLLTSCWGKNALLETEQIVDIHWSCWFCRKIRVSAEDSGALK